MKHQIYKALRKNGQTFNIICLPIKGPLKFIWRNIKVVVCMITSCESIATSSIHTQKLVVFILIRISRLTILVCRISRSRILVYRISRLRKLVCRISRSWILVYRISRSRILVLRRRQCKKVDRIRMIRKKFNLN